MKPREYFPLGKAHGAAFCNRTEETDWLINNIKANKHSLLIAPRRFGKSSLAEKAVKKSGLAMTTLNFNICSDEHDIEALIRQGSSQLISQTLGSTDKLMNSIKKYVTNLTPKISIGTQFAHLELTATNREAPVSNVLETLMLVENLFAEKKRSAVMIFDEFQTVGLVSKGSGVEAGIRNIAQDMKQVAIIFSGSNRSLLQTMFEDETRPLYKLCRKLRLQRITALHYQKHLNHAAQLTWSTDLSNDVFTDIMLLSERHPYYVNYLCDIIWTQCKKSPKKSDVLRAWETLLDEEQSDANSEIASLSMGQKKILRHIANHSGENLMSSQTIKTTGMALSSIASALTGLIEKDVIEQQDKQYTIISPVIKYFMRASPY